MIVFGPDRVVRRGAVLWRRVGDEILIRPRGADDLTVLTGSGAALWDALAEGGTVAALAQQLAAAHGVDAAQVETDIAATLTDLHAARAVDA